MIFSGGTNDFHVLPPPDLDYWTAQYEAFIEMVSHSHHHPTLTSHMHALSLACILAELQCAMTSSTHMDNRVHNEQKNSMARVPWALSSCRTLCMCLFNRLATNQCRDRLCITYQSTSASLVA